MDKIKEKLKIWVDKKKEIEQRINKLGYVWTKQQVIQIINAIV